MDQEKFLEVCVEEYSDKMFDIKDSALSASDLQDSHQAFKDKILETLQSKWRAASGESSVPDELRKKLTKELDSTFNKLKRMFERKNKREQNELAAISIAKDCLNFYNDEMDQYFKNNPNLSPKDIDKVHSKITAQTFSKAKSKSGGEISSNLMTLLKRDTEARKVVYIERAEMIMKSNEDPAIGIDLGTTMCCVMVFYKGECKLVPNWSQGSARTTPSYVAFTEDGKDTFGIDAKEEAYKQPETTIYDAKRMIGRHFNDIMLQSDLQKWPFEVINEDGNVKIKTWDRIRYPHEVSARLLTRFRLMAEDFLHVPRGSIKKAVITVPAYFTEPQRRATSDAAKCAGLEVLNILSEPTAAAIAYSWDRHDVGITRKALIYDLGGGTFDVAIAKVTRDKVEILCVDGDTHLGGQDFDQQLMDYCIQKFEDKESINLAVLRNSTEPEKRHNARSALSRLKLQCEKAKERLTTSEKAIVQVEKIYGNKDLWVEVTKVMFERLIRTLIRSTIDIVEKAIAEAKSKGVESKNDIDDIILVGGSTRLPIVIEMVSDFFGGKQLCKNINPDEAVAFGAAIQAAILNKNGTVKKIFVQDVTPMSLGVDVVGDKLSIVIPKNSNIPCSFKETYVTAYDNQTTITWEVYQGENPVSSKNYKLGEFSTEGLIPMPAGFQEVTVTMRFDASGMLHVNAVSESTGRYNSITIAADRMGMDTNTISRLTNECKQIKNF